MNFNYIIILLLIITIFLIIKKNKLFILSLIFIIIISILSKNNQENFSSLDIYYPTHDLQTIDQENMLHIFKDPNSKNIILKNNNNTTEENIISSDNIFNNYIINNNYSYILVKPLDKKFYTLNGYIYSISDNSVYLEEINRINLKYYANYGLKLLSNKVDTTSIGFSIFLQPYNNKYNSNIPGYIQGQNNGNVIINPIQGNLNNIFYLSNCIDVTDNINNKLNLLNIDNLEKIYQCNLNCNNQLYLSVSTLENTINNKKKVILKSDLTNDDNWLLFIYNNTPDINNLYYNFI